MHKGSAEESERRAQLGIKALLPLVEQGVAGCECPQFGSLAPGSNFRHWLHQLDVGGQFLSYERTEHLHIGCALRNQGVVLLSSSFLLHAHGIEVALARQAAFLQAFHRAETNGKVVL